ncbi:MAG: murein L,D-transpeptidase catalytic domain family protein [Marinilabiliales bacterium]|nr:murein L,D-transpeptidase catalytic domain family protein [Marinilabiliales bacterium]
MGKPWKLLLVCWFWSATVVAPGQEEWNLYKVRELYVKLQLAKEELDPRAFDLALKGWSRLRERGALKHDELLTIADYTQSANRKRLYVIDLRNEKLLFRTYVAHGRNSGEEFATLFSNQLGSCKSSLGFYVTGKPLKGSHTGYSMELTGMEKGINDRAIARQIILHGAWYVTEDFIRKNGRLGRSLGCPVVPPDQVHELIGIIQDGSCLFLYHSDPSYLRESVLLK